MLVRRHLGHTACGERVFPGRWERGRRCVLSCATSLGILKSVMCRRSGTAVFPPVRRFNVGSRILLMRLTSSPHGISRSPPPSRDAVPVFATTRFVSHVCPKGTCPAHRACVGPEPARDWGVGTGRPFCFCVGAGGCARLGGARLADLGRAPSAAWAPSSCSPLSSVRRR